MMKRIRKTTAVANPADDRPDVSPFSYVDPSARIIGNVEIGPRVYVGPCAVIRADEAGACGEVAPITIWPECNVQDGVILHSLGGHRIFVGSRVSLSHGCIVHGPCSIGDHSFIGFRAIVFKANLGAGTYVGTGAIVEGVELPPGALVPAGAVVNSAEAVSRLPKTSEDEQAFMLKVVETNIKLVEGYLGLAKAKEASEGTKS
jgi:carbonic anhydrase/acetyltransferase-like protein (isoleucine patch superfamily)